MYEPIVGYHDGGRPVRIGPLIELQLRDGRTGAWILEVDGLPVEVPSLDYGAVRAAAARVDPAAPDWPAAGRWRATWPQVRRRLLAERITLLDLDGAAVEDELMAFQRFRGRRRAGDV